jgi:hypothetical protein
MGGPLLQWCLFVGGVLRHCGSAWLVLRFVRLGVRTVSSMPAY